MDISSESCAIDDSDKDENWKKDKDEKPESSESDDEVFKNILRIFSI